MPLRSLGSNHALLAGVDLRLCVFVRGAFALEHGGGAVEGEAGAALDLDVEDFADVAGVAFDEDDFVAGGTAHEAVGVGFAGAFAEDFDALADEAFAALAGLGVDEFEGFAVALFFDVVGELRGHGGGGGVAAGAVFEDEGVVEVDAADEVEGGGVVGVGLAGESADDVGGEGDVGARGADGFSEPDEFFVCVAAVHGAEDGVTAALQGEVDVGHQFGE